MYISLTLPILRGRIPLHRLLYNIIRRHYMIMDGRSISSGFSYFHILSWFLSVFLVFFFQLIINSNLQREWPIVLVMMIHCSLVKCQAIIVVVSLLQFSQSLYSIIEVFVLSIETQEFEVINQVVPRTMLTILSRPLSQYRRSSVMRDGQFW